MSDQMQISLGKCHYGDFNEAATATAVKEDGTGWIAICEEHRDQAEKDGYTPGEPLDNLEPVTGEGADVPEGERESESGDKLDDEGESGDQTDGESGDGARDERAKTREDDGDDSLDDLMDDENENASR